MQARLADQRRARTDKRSASRALLLGKLFDAAGQRMTPTHANKAGIRYRYYISAALLQGIGLPAGSVRRVPAPEIERQVVEAIRQAIASTEADDQALVARHLDRVEVGQGQLTIRLSTDAEDDQLSTIRLAWSAPTQARHREIVVPPDRSEPARTMRVETRATLLAGIARGRRWLAEIVEDPSATIDTIAARERCGVRQVNRMLSLATISPSIVQAAIEGALPTHLGVSTLFEADLSWEAQRRAFGLTPNGQHETRLGSPSRSHCSPSNRTSLPVRSERP